MNFDLIQYALECNAADPQKFAAQAENLRDIILEANKSVNLTRITDPVEFMVKHVADSLAIGKFFPEEIANAREVADLGCGGGFPTLVLAMAYPHLHVTGIDSTGKKVRLVQETAGKLGLSNVSVIHARVEELNRQKQFMHRFDIVTARAVAQGKILAKYASNMPKENGSFIFYKTPQQAAEDLETLR
ncbi:MAG: 16S rRNA (guanine(527)-N(7))-methyltransferase RsmG [Lentisphaeria bacterium]|nr:16S rRNA (guanine(527)-N(7))-methyltransferase RsmG [Lentisphaeria bacterium]